MAPGSRVRLLPILARDVLAEPMPLKDDRIAVPGALRPDQSEVSRCALERAETYS
jgi:hypothetical protein